MQCSVVVDACGDCKNVHLAGYARILRTAKNKRLYCGSPLKRKPTSSNASEGLVAFVNLLP